MAQQRRGGFKRRKKVDYIAANKIEYVDYKDTELLSRFVSERGKILPRRVTGTSAKNQRKVTTAIKRARVMALMPYVYICFFHTYHPLFFSYLYHSFANIAIKFNQKTTFYYFLFYFKFHIITIYKNILN